MARGKPAPDQIDHANGMLETMTDYHAKDGLDVRNYGVLDGLPSFMFLCFVYIYVFIYPD